MRMQAQIARRSKNQGETDRALGELIDAADRAARMVDSILALARLDARTVVSIEDGTVALGHLVQMVIGEFSAAAERRGIRITATTDESTVTGDEEALAVALRNMLNNALRFARSRIVVEVTHFYDHVTLAVRDDGPGFSEDSKQRAFNRFFRGPEEGGRSDGAGLGLALVLRVAQLHSAWVQIVPGIDNGGGVAIHFAQRAKRKTADNRR
jgi:signal transduction histidine kinase